MVSHPWCNGNGGLQKMAPSPFSRYRTADKGSISGEGSAAAVATVFHLEEQKFNQEWQQRALAEVE